MFSTMVEYDGAGLAAPQVHVSKQLALVGGEYDEDDNALIRVVINPEIEVTSEDLFGMYEGCLSVPGMRGYVERPVAIKVKALDEDAEPIELELEGYPAVVMQHECDHLQGKLYLDRMKDIRKLVFETEGQRYLPLDKMIDGREV
jgi:peptide deformylase